MSLWAYALNLADQNPLGQSTTPNVSSSNQPANPNQELKSPPVNLPVRPPTEPNITPPVATPPRPSVPPVSGMPPKPSQPPPPQFPPRPTASPVAPSSQPPPAPSVLGGSMMPPAQPKPSFSPTPPPPVAPSSFPPKPSLPSPLASQSMPPRSPVSTPSTPSPSAVPPPPSQPSQSQGLKSSIRTMNEDLSALKKGQTPIGFTVQKGPEQPSISVPNPFKAPTVPSKLPQSPISPIDIPPPSSRSGRSFSALIIAVPLVAIIGFSVWFFVFHKASLNVGQRPSPSGTIEITSTPLPIIESVFPDIKSVTIDVNENVFPQFKELVSSDIKNISGPNLYKVFAPQKTNGEKYTFSEFSAASSLRTPQEVIDSIDDKSFYMTLMTEGSNNVGYGFIVKVNDLVKLKTAMLNWEINLTDNLTKLFIFDPKKAASHGFLDNIYQNIAIRYRNFPDPAVTIDYSIVSAPNGDSYLIFTNSREHIYSIIDRILTILK